MEQFRTDRAIQYISLGSSYSNTGSIRDDPYWTSRKNSFLNFSVLMLTTTEFISVNLNLH